MRLTKLSYDTTALVEFYREGLESLGALCERTWFDRLQVVAEGRAAKVWESAGELLEVEVRFPPPDQTGARDAAKEVFPGCPLTFRLADALCPPPLVFHRAVLQMPEPPKAPPGDVAEKLWRAQYPDTFRWQLETPFQPNWHFSLLALARCEIQAIDQHWSLHRLVLSLPDGQPDEALSGELGFCSVALDPAQPVSWPPPNRPPGNRCSATPCCANWKASWRPSASARKPASGVNWTGLTTTSPATSRSCANACGVSNAARPKSSLKNA